ncbi:estradiol 17-beta-dehydrogenase [Sporormia fimetaria CBS 119925]|uniref:Estradiol 17-beta-dehydrogenase n=1 Tax=Sporormia fimetaria CBS 119925 TaxID=1340428 RepID=A0A6A6VQ84_9PLEO|nr:estradiol 17-beta-dehydrogenase [Sporormia fimetaria CBS 119925]
MSEPQTPVWFITGSSSGFGKHIALEALSRGHHVIATARDVSKISFLADKGAHTLALDVTSPLSQLQKIAKEANDIYGYITHLVNAAGYILIGAVEETTPEEDLAHFTTNVFGTLNTSKSLLPYLRATAGHRTITNFGSIASWEGGAGAALYCGSKFAVSGISESMTKELAPLGIRVTVAEPGYFRTGILNQGTKVYSRETMEMYQKGEPGELRRTLEVVDNRQPGDVGKGARVLVDVLTKSGGAQGREVPIRVPLGSDCPEVIRRKIRETEEILREWEPITTKTDHDDV